jgi:hypothetical protein
MAEIKEECDLTDDEIMLIIYTSLDHDYLPNLLFLAGQFTMWWNLNFEGETQEEVDFRTNKVEIWDATVKLSKLIIAKEVDLDESKGKEKTKLHTEKWWLHQRYSHFGDDLAKALEADQKAKDDLRELFRCQNDKLSYSDFNQFHTNKLKIKLEGWEEDAIEGRLDRLGMAFIEFNEFNEFSMDYGIDWQEPLLENDLEDILDAKLNLSYKDYKLGKNDYFRGCKTMLTSEKAALAKCSQIWDYY